MDGTRTVTRFHEIYCKLRTFNLISEVEMSVLCPGLSNSLHGHQIVHSLGREFKSRMRFQVRGVTNIR